MNLSSWVWNIVWLSSETKIDMFVVDCYVRCVCCLQIRVKFTLNLESLPVYWVWANESLDLHQSLPSRQLWILSEYFIWFYCFICSRWLVQILLYWHNAYVFTVGSDFSKSILDIAKAVQVYDILSYLTILSL